MKEVPALLKVSGSVSLSLILSPCSFNWNAWGTSLSAFLNNGPQDGTLGLFLTIMISCGRERWGKSMTGLLNVDTCRCYNGICSLSEEPASCTYQEQDTHDPVLCELGNAWIVHVHIASRLSCECKLYPQRKGTQLNSYITG